MQTEVHAGLEGIVAATTRLSHVDGLAGELIIAGYPLAELAPNATFEETVYLLWHDRLPNRTELETFRSQLAHHRTAAPASLDLLRAAASARLDSMDALRMAAGSLSLVGGEERHVLVAQMPTLVAAYWRLSQGQEPIAPRNDLSHAANYLWMLFGTEPSAQQIRALDTYLNTVVDHGLNASTFTARVIIATQSDMISAITGAIGALKGPLHGGAPGPALDMVFAIGTPERAEAELRQRLERGERLMGFGHRVYKVRDPRADVLALAADAFFRGSDKQEFYELVQHVEQTALRLLEEYKPGRRLQTNVEFYTALLLHGLGLPTELFTPTFTISRVGGWIAHAIEHQQTGRLIRPQSLYTGPTNRDWVDVNERS